MNTNKPFIQMTDAELKETFREIGLLDNFEILQDARHGMGQDILLAIAVLTLPDGTERRVYVAFEYGDGDGENTVQGFIDEINETPGMLKDGEKVELRIQRVTELVNV